MGKLTISMTIFYSYVSLPEGTLYGYNQPENLYSSERVGDKYPWTFHENL